MRSSIVGIVLLAMALVSTPVQAQIRALGTNQGADIWCEDSGTYCWNKTREMFNGVRFIAEPKFGTVFDQGDNRIESGGFGSLTLVGAEFNVLGALIAGQGTVITPGKVTLDAQSPLVINKRLVDPAGNLSVDIGWAIGVSFFDGVIAFGLGRISFDSRGIVNPTDAESHNRFLYLNVQTASAVRATIKRLK